MADVIVIGKGYGITLGVVRSLGEAGYGVRLLALSAYTQRIPGKSKYISQLRYSGSSFEAIFRGLEALRGEDERILVIPLNDNTTMLLDQHSKQLADHYLIPSVRDNLGGIRGLMDKLTQKQIARQCGLPTALGHSYSTDEEGIGRAVREAPYPCFQKPLASIVSNSGAKTCFAKCADPEELQKAMRMARKNQCDKVLLEEYLPIDKELTAYGVAANGQVCIPACMEALREGFHFKRGIAAEGIVKSAACFGETKKALEEFVRVIGLTGLFCIDLIQSGGVLYFSEINLRAGGSGYAITLAGANLPASLADLVYKPLSRGPEDIRREVHFVNEHIEKSAFSEGFITAKEYDSHLSGQQEKLIKSRDDPKPWKNFQVIVLKLKLKKKMMSLLHMK